MKLDFRQRLLGTTLLVGANLLAAPAFAQDAPPTDGGTADLSNPSGPVEAQPTPSTSAEGEAVDTSQDIIVTGSRIPQPNLTSAAPVTVVTNQEVKLTGTTRIEDVLNQLPSVGASQASGISNGGSGTAEVDLRYLGSKRTLSLVNGRRLTPGDPNSASQAADLNIIPASLIKRVEVLTGGASSVYGADAVAGVVNFIIDTNFEGVRFDGQYSGYFHKNHDPFVAECVTVSASSGCTAVGQRAHMSDILGGRGFPQPTGNESDGQAFDGTVSIGASFDDGRGHAVAYAGYRKVKAVLQRDRDYSACVIQNSGSLNPRCGGSATANPGNAFFFTTFDATTSTTAALGPGTITLGPANLYNFGPLNYFQRPDERYIAGAFADYEITPAIKPYLEFMFMDDHTLAQIAPSGDFFNTNVINCNNPLLSAQQVSVICNPANLITGFIGNFPVAAGAPYNTVTNGVGSLTPLDFIDPATGTTYNRALFQLGRRNTEGGPRISDLKHTSYRLVVGSRGDLGPAWSYDASFQYGRTNYEQVYRNEFSVARLVRALDVINDPRANSPTFGTPVCRSAVTGDDVNCVPYDVFGTTGPSAASINYLNVFGVITGQTSEQIANVNVTGALGEYGLQTPWSDEGFGINVGAEYRKESLDLNPDQSFQTGDLSGQGAPTLPVSGSFRTNEVFGEVSLPLIHNNFIDDLTLSAGFRKSWYTLSSGRKYDTDTYKASIEFAPIADVRFRGSYNRASRAPNIQELFAPQFVGLDGSKDPCAGRAIQATDYGCIASGLAVGSGTPANPAGQYNGLLGGDPTLNPEKATTKTVGVILQPRFIPRFALTVDYFNIKLKDAIQGYGADAIIAACINQSTATFTSPACALINRSAAGSLWLSPDGFINDLPNNNGVIKTDGYDISSSYSHGFGRIGNLSASFNGTYLRKYKVNNGLTEPYDCAGLYGPVCSSGVVASSAPMPKWRHKARVTLEMPFGLGLSAQWRHIGKVKAETLEDNETIGGATTADPGLRIKSYNYLDLAATLSLNDRYNFRVGMNNVFDKDPPRVTSGNAGLDGTNLCPTGPCNGNTYPGTWDALGRYAYIGATLNFAPPKHSPAPVPVLAPPPPPPAPPPATQTCQDGSVILATDACPAPPPPPPPPAPEPQRG
ncbi:MAG: TonB-dependent receptor [Sphingomicrobium sp.]